MSELGYYRHATIHGDNVVFVCEDDLWTVRIEGGIARRLTAGEGLCSNPRFSPDGKHIAYVGREEGDCEVYVMPAEGGVARRLTYMGGEVCIVAGWSEDGKEVLFCSDGKSPFFRHTELYSVSIDGGLPRDLKLGHAVAAAFSKAGKVIGRNNLDPARWKRYRGGTAGELWIDAAGKGIYTRLVDLKGNEAAPNWIGDRVYFLSDHLGIGNVFSCKADGSDLKQHSFEEEYYVRFPSTDGENIIYTAGGDLVLLNPKAGQSKRLDVAIPGAPRQTVRKFVPAVERLEHFAPHPKGHSVALVSRGQPFTMPNWEEAAVQHGIGSGARYRDSEWLHDGQRFVVTSDETGKERLEIHYANQSKKSEPITDGDIGRIVELATSPVDDQIVMANHKHELILVDAKSKKTTLLDRSPAERITGISWSPDGRWVAYTWSPHPNQSLIRVAEVKTGKLHDVTKIIRNDFLPCFDPQGNYLYFLSNREFNPVYDTQQFDLSFPLSTKPYCVTLRKDTPNPFIPNPRPLFEDEDEEAEESVEKNGSAKSEKKSKKVTVDIDFDGITNRILAFPVDEAMYVNLLAAKKRVLFTEFESKGIKRGGTWWDEHHEVGVMHAYDFEEQRCAPFLKDVTEARLAFDHRTLVYRSREHLRVVDAAEKLNDDGPQPVKDEKPGRKSGWIDLARVNVMIEPNREWQQMFDETWRLQREHFWDEGMLQVDWELVRKRYSRLVPRLRSRAELSDLIWEMHGELGTSHAYEFGGDHRHPPTYRRGYLGAEFSFDDATSGYKIEKIIRAESWEDDGNSALAQPGCGIDEGDIICGVGGRATSKQVTVEELLINTAEHEVMLTIRKKDGSTRQVVVKPLAEERYLRYRAWIDHNRQLVHERTNGRVGYLHIPDMGPWGFAEFHKGYLLELPREGLVVDVRYNRGGHVSALLLEKLARKRVGYDISRWGVPQPYPTESVAGPMVAITNQFAGSDGDIFSHCFKLYKLGPLVGKRTWGGVVGIWPRHRLVDGTVTTQPEFSFWFKDVGWKVENYGTDPDYDVDYGPHDYAAGHDPQMAKALELISEELRKNPFSLPDFGQRPSLPLPAAKASASAAKV
jgi:tricorn protease